MTNNIHHTRVVSGITAPLERPALQWLAARTPTWTSPDMLTVIGVLGAAITFFGYCLTQYHAGFLWLASAGLAVNWLGDSLDGTLARFRHIERPQYGFFIDHMADTVSELLIFLGLGLTPFVRFEIACLALIGYLLLSTVVYVRTILEGIFQITFGKLGPTEARLILVLANTSFFLTGNPEVRLPYVTTTAADLLLMFVAVVAFVTFCVSVLQQARRLAKMSDLSR
ncbi:MAG: CDP-alcohol phosphatidyltransferase family protein [Thermoanaerobaculales bacterium]|nr:CDP-alcohol phosphatidyltransferase family protein [Thermoanaerobaculales bacterium]